MGVLIYWKEICQVARKGFDDIFCPVLVIAMCAGFTKLSGLFLLSIFTVYSPKKSERPVVWQGFQEGSGLILSDK